VPNCTAQRFKLLRGNMSNAEAFSKYAQTDFSFIRGIMRRIFGFVYKGRLYLVIIAMRCLAAKGDTRFS